MKRALLLLVLFPAWFVAAQPVIQWADYPLSYAEGAETYLANDAEFEVFAIGDSGSTGNVYDFSAFGYDNTPSTATYLDPAKTPYAAVFPTATHSVESTTPYGPMYQFSEYKDNTLYNLGLGWNVLGTELIVQLDPIQPSVTFPLKLGDSWDYHSNVITLVPGLTQQFNVRNNVIAAGSLVTPLGTHDCLVIKVTSLVDQYDNTTGLATRILQSSVTYNFISAGGILGIMSADTLDIWSMDPHILTLGYSVAITTDDVAPAASPEAPALSPVYPNPVSSGNDAVVTWSVESRASVRVLLFDAMGREVQTVFEGDAAPGEHTRVLQTTGLIPGVYFLRIQRGESVKSTPVVVRP